MALAKRRPNNDIFICNRNGKFRYAFESKEVPSSCLMSEEERIALTPKVGKTVGDIMQRTQTNIYRKLLAPDGWALGPSIRVGDLPEQYHQLPDGTYKVLPENLELPPGKYYLPA